jgi:tetratricopeptide (TPR) repeat protein
MRLKDVLLPEEITEDEIYSILKNNIEQMIQVSQKNSIPIVFLAKARNPKTMYIRDNYSINKRFIREGTQDQWETHYNKGVRSMREGRYEKALEEFEKVRQLYKSSYEKADELLSLYTGECYEKLGFYDRAGLEYNKLLDKKHLMLNQILKDTALKYGVTVVDVQEVFVKNAKNGIIGYENYFVDGLHMTLCGNKLIGRVLATLLANEKYISNDMSGTLLSESSSSVWCQSEEALPERFKTLDVFTSLGWSAFNQGKIEEALAMGKMAVGLDPLEPQAHMLLGYVYAKMQRNENEYEEWETLREIWAERLK